MNIIARIRAFIRRIAALPEKMYLVQEALGRIERRQVAQYCSRIEDAEFRVFSQWGEDGIIQYLTHAIPINRKIFVEFGVENYTQANTRFLLTNDYWAGLVLDGSQENIAYLKKDVIYWGYNLKAECAFITKDNINDLIRRNGIEGDIGLLSVDIDGNDYWVWKAIDCISPRIVICEYNGLWGPTAKVSTPYNPEFVRGRAHFSMVYYGASITALTDLAGKKGYSLVAGNEAGNNIFFVRNDLLGALRIVKPSEVYRQSAFRECHDESGNLTFEDFATRQRRVRSLDLYDLDSKSLKKVETIPGIITQAER